jgi:hypothetical protein
MEYLSTSALASELGIKSADLFDKLKTLGWIERQNDKWVLTDRGKQKGGQTRTNPKFGEFVVWPENIAIDSEQQHDKAKLLNATAIGKHFGVSSQRLNLILSEIGWLEKNISGWTTTKLGKNVGGNQFEHEASGGTYVLWPESILKNKSLVGVFNDGSAETMALNSSADTGTPQQTSAVASNNFRDKFEAKHRTKDGHFVRSRAEVIIDDTLYDYGLVHAYEKKVPVEEDLYTDFYLPNGKVYIEFWGMENDPKYLERKKVKLEI